MPVRRSAGHCYGWQPFLPLAQIIQAAAPFEQGLLSLVGQLFQALFALRRLRTHFSDLALDFLKVDWHVLVLFLTQGSPGLRNHPRVEAVFEWQYSTNVCSL
jgi:hypothetical protein